ncbi:MAG: L,D-transpeptidase [Bdellovibrionales bacterium]|nr:L,D-transpeptidase [Bdellovibrionales bacterium]
MKFVSKTYRSSILVLCLFSATACSILPAPEAETTAESTMVFDQTRYLESGTILLSHAVPERANTESLAQNAFEGAPPVAGPMGEPTLFAPLIGYFPPAHAYLPADNETWLEIDKAGKKLTLFKGKSPIKEMTGEGEISIGSGDYYLQHKQKQPLWYAPDQYFERRQLAVPEPGDRLRYRRGALGSYALYPTTTFPIHCGPVWSEDVGGLRISAADLSSIYYMLPVGAPIVVK